MKRESAIYSRPIYNFGKPTIRKDEVVRVMARAEGYAMVRHKGCMPFAVNENDLRPMEIHSATPPTRAEG